VTARRIDLIVSLERQRRVVADEEIQLARLTVPDSSWKPCRVSSSRCTVARKANQYLLRGYNLDHGTDLATYVDDMPVNQPTHAHGQGYTDLNSRSRARRRDTYTRTVLQQHW